MQKSNSRIVDDLKKSHTKSTLDSIVNIVSWCKSNNAAVGVCGSSIGGKFSSPNDLDLVIVLNLDQNINQTIHNSPLIHLDLSFWEYFISNYKAKNIDIFATHHNKNSNIHVEIYPKEIFQKILLLTEFTIRRIRKGPLLNKEIVLNSTVGRKITQTIIPSKTCSNGIYSEVENIIMYNNCLYIGIHLEKLLICKYIYSTCEERNYICRAWDKISVFFAHNRQLPFNGKVENIFHVSNKLPRRIREKIRSNLSKNKDIQELLF